MTEEHRKRLGEMSRERWKNPEYKARMIEAVKRANTGRRDSEERIKKRSESLKRAHFRRKALGRDKLNVTDEHREAKRRDLNAMRNDPRIEKKRKERALKAQQKPSWKIKQMMNLQAMQDRKRGFKVPARIHTEYKRLRKTKTAKEAGKILGLLP